MSRLKDIREKKGYSQEEVAEKAEISIRTYKNMEKSLKSLYNMRLVNVARVAKVLDCKPEDFIDD